MLHYNTKKESDSGTQNVTKKLRLCKPVGGGRPVVFATRGTDGGKEIGERKTDRDRQDDQERQKGRERETDRDQKDSSGTKCSIFLLCILMEVQVQNRQMMSNTEFF